MSDDSVLNKNIEFIKNRLAVLAHIPEELINVAVSDSQWESNDWIVRFVFEEYMQMMNDDKYEHPATWWDMLKEAHAPRWFLKWFPVHYKVITFAAVYPQFIPLPEERFGQCRTIKYNVEVT